MYRSLIRSDHGFWEALRIAISDCRGGFHKWVDFVLNFVIKSIEKRFFESFEHNNFRPGAFINNLIFFRFRSYDKASWSLSIFSLIFWIFCRSKQKGEWIQNDLYGQPLPYDVKLRFLWELKTSFFLKMPRSLA